jgi:pimeloyl-ACP methyl ester carboxylesterase
MQKGAAKRGAAMWATVAMGDKRAPDGADVTGAVAAAEVGGTSRFAELPGVRLHYVEAGRGPLVVLLHGFPNFWYLWRRQIPALVEAGYRVIAPDLRGYNLSSRPSRVRDYAVGAVAGDVAALIRHVGERRAVVAGHDWGGVVAWRLASEHGAVVSRVAVLNAPHPARFAEELRTPDQLARSSYAFFFQLPLLPELVLRAFGFAAIRRVLRGDPARGAFGDAEIDLHVRALSMPGALRSSVHYYRAAGRSVVGEVRRAARRTIDVPVLLLWGERVPFLRVELTEGLGRWVHRLEVRRVAGAGHWVMADAPDVVNRALIEFARQG